ncbi:hypothetical protein EXU48_09340 [Occultella glacieicola]|uniref:Uncharacterized protein n=1 Tax=Occultella glacieicola TaxID=2518684 RepID=A0ABY2E640_9MICO|nr:hypothetical protein [Occultella glacieicola]TDE94971.1 hypothetical protein EXU48_09340 [Occultella glacieicola]
MTSSTDAPLQVSGVFPSLAQVGDFGPPRSELGVGALMPYNGVLYVQNYNSHKAASGAGVSLRRIDADLRMEVVAETLGVDGTYTNRFVHYPTGHLVIGPHVISPDHTIRTVPELTGHRLCGTTRHLTEPDTHVYVLTMEGEVFSLDLTTLACELAWDLNDELDTEGEWKVHYKDCYSSFGRLVVCSNEYAEPEWRGERARGRLAEFDGESWRILERKPFTAIGGRHEFGGTIFASGWDAASAILEVFTEADGTWRRYRLPKASHTFDHKWQTEWPRIREVEHERLLLDHHGMFYELSPWAYGNRIWGVRPVSTHLWVLGDFCSWRGMFVAGADNASPSHGLNPTTAEPQSGMFFGKTDDLWSFGKPSGWGGPWWDTDVDAGEASDPYLMTGFDNKCVHLQNHGDTAMTVHLEIDARGDGTFGRVTTLEVAPGALVTHTFPPGFSAHWARLVSDHAGRASAQFFYT